jgi:hypothetical protein
VSLQQHRRALERGDYLVNSVMGCFFCHSDRDWKAPWGRRPLRLAKVLGTVSRWAGKLFARNITPDRETGIGSWSDDAIARAIREGVDNEGKTLFPIMPYQNYRSLSDEDLASLVVYLKSIPAGQE